MDLAYVANGGLHMLFGDGKGGFTQGPVTPVNFDGSNVMVGDFDGDGNADLAWGDLINFTTATVLYGDSTGHFIPKYVTATETSTFTSGDVNSDGRTDLIALPFDSAATTTGLTKKYFAVYYGDAARTFAKRATISTKHCPINPTPTVADIDGNGINDVVLLEADCGVTPKCRLR